MADLTVTRIGNGAYRVSDDTHGRVAYAAGPPGERWVFLDGNVYVFDLTQRSKVGTKRKADEHALAAPMPATVAAITVEPGQRVSKGDVLIVLEAMKMELPIKSPRDGLVKAIACRLRELVQPGVPLLELE